MIQRALLFAFAISVPFLAPAHADTHCAAVMETVEEMISMLDALSETCESDLETARMTLETGREQASTCGCAMAAEGFTMQIEASKSTRYSCGNKTQALRTLGTSMGDTLSCCYGC